MNYKVIDKEKNFEKNFKKISKIPLHHIDTDIIMESGKETRLGNICAAYLNRIGYKYRGTVSLSVLGEFLLIILKDIEPDNRELVFKAFDRIVKKQKISFLTPKTEMHQIALKIISLDSRIEQTDALHYALAVQEKANAFVTFDQKMVGNRTLEKDFGVKIIHPENL